MYNELIDDLIEALRPIEVTGDAATSMCLAMELSEAKAEIEQLKRERDAALSDLYGNCECCSNIETCYVDPCYCINANMWQWRGIKEDAEDG